MRKLLLISTILLLCATATEATTSNSQILRSLAQTDFIARLSGHGLVSAVCIGKSSKDRSIPLVVIRNPKVPISRTARIFVICRQHGNEPASTEGLMQIIRAYSTNPREADVKLLDKVTFLIVPMMNPDGAGLNQRRNGNNADLNRDWIAQKQPETQAVARAIANWQPDMVLDAHELDPNDPKGDFIEYLGTKAGVDRPIAQKTDSLQKTIRSILKTHGYSTKGKVISDHNPPRLAHRYFPLWKTTPAILVETRQSGARALDIRQRAQKHIVVVMAAARYLAGEKLPKQAHRSGQTGTSRENAK